jgi:hypothetical protein
MIGTRWRRWLRRRDQIKTAKFITTLTTERARCHMAAYQAKADIEWDFKFMSPMDKSWRDDLILVVMSYPLLGLMVPGLREPIMEGFKFLASIDPSAPQIFSYGWAVIFAATFGINLTKSIRLPGQFAALVSAVSSVPDDVPLGVAGAAQDAVSDSPSPAPQAQQETSKP